MRPWVPGEAERARAGGRARRCGGAAVSRVEAYRGGRSGRGSPRAARAWTDSLAVGLSTPAARIIGRFAVVRTADPPSPGDLGGARPLSAWVCNARPDIGYESDTQGAGSFWLPAWTQVPWEQR